MQFPFVIFRSSPSGAFPSSKTTKRPVLFLTLQRNNLSVNALALVDSGADESLFPASLAGQLGIAIPNQNSFVFSGTAAAPQLAYFETVTVQVWNVPPDGGPRTVAFTFELYAGFCETLEHVGMGLLGQNGFFSRYAVTINNGENYFDVAI